MWHLRSWHPSRDDLAGITASPDAGVGTRSIGSTAPQNAQQHERVAEGHAGLAGLSFSGLVVMGLGCGFVGPNIYVFAQTLAGPSVAGKWTGLQNSLGKIAGVVVGPLTGWMVDRTGHFGSAFGICSAVAACGIVSWVFFVDRLEETAWRAEPEHIQVAAS